MAEGLAWWLRKSETCPNSKDSADLIKNTLNQIKNAIGNIEQKISVNNAIFASQAEAIKEIADSVHALNESAQTLEQLAKKVLAAPS